MILPMEIELVDLVVAENNKRSDKMIIFDETIENTTAKERLELLELFKKFVKQDYNNYASKYSEPEYIVLLNKKQTLFFDNADELGRISTKADLK